MNFNNSYSDQRMQELFLHHNDLMARLRDMEDDSQSEIETEPDELHLLRQDNFVQDNQNERMVNRNSASNWFGGGIVTEAMQRLVPIPVGDDQFPGAVGQAVEIEPFTHFMQPPLIPVVNMEQRQRLDYDTLESPSVEVVVPGLMIPGDMNNQAGARPASSTSEDEDVVYLGRVVANQERSDVTPRPRINNSPAAGPFLANNIRPTDHVNGGNVQGIQASALVNTANPFAALSPISPSPPTSQGNPNRFNSRRPTGSQQGTSTFGRPQHSATAFSQDAYLANNRFAEFGNRGVRNPVTQPNYFPGSVFNQFAFRSPPPPYEDDLSPPPPYQDDDIVFLREYRNNQQQQGQNLSNNRQSELGREVNRGFPTFAMPNGGNGNPFANAPPPPAPPLNFAFPEGILSYTVPVISLDQVRDRLRQRDEAIAGRGPPPPPLVPDGQAELCYFGTPGFAGLNIGGYDGREDNRGRQNGAYTDRERSDWERFQQNAPGDLNPPPYRFGSNDMPFEGRGFNDGDPRNFF